MWCKVKCLDRSEQDVIIQPAATAKRCLDKVLRKLGVMEVEIFGLQHRKSGVDHHHHHHHHHSRHHQASSPPCWLNLRNPMRNQVDGRPPHRLELRVKYLISPYQVQQPVTHHLLYLEMKRQVKEGRLSRDLDVEAHGHLASLMAQIESSKPGELVSYGSLLPPSHQHLSSVARDYHEQVRSMSGEECRELFMEKVSSLPGYGVETFKCLAADNGEEVELHVSHHGVTVHSADSSFTILNHFPASSISYVHYERRYFILEMLPGSPAATLHFDDATKPKFQFHHRSEARAVSRATIEQLAFFRMRTVTGEIKHASYPASLVGNLLSLVGKESGYRRLYECDVVCTLHEMSERVGFLLTSEVSQGRPYHKRENLLPLRRAATVSSPSSPLLGGGRSRRALRDVRRNTSSNGYRRWSGAAGMHSAPNQSPISVDSGAVSAGTDGRATHSEAEGDEVDEDDEDVRFDDDAACTTITRRISFAPCQDEPYRMEVKPISRSDRYIPAYARNSVGAVSTSTSYNLGSAASVPSAAPGATSMYVQPATARITQLNTLLEEGSSGSSSVSTHRRRGSELLARSTPRRTASPQAHQRRQHRLSSTPLTLMSRAASPGAGSLPNLSVGTATTPQQRNPHQVPSHGISGESVVGGSLAGSASSSVSSAKLMCKICMRHRLSTVFCPCGHSVCCRSCSGTFTTCPICRAAVDRVQTVFFI